MPSAAAPSSCSRALTRWTPALRTPSGAPPTREAAPTRHWPEPDQSLNDPIAESVTYYDEGRRPVPGTCAYLTANARWQACWRPLSGVVAWSGSRWRGQRRGSTSGSPLRVTAGALQRTGEHLRGSVVVTDVGGSSVAGTEAAMVIRQTHHQALEGVGDVVLPRLAAGSRRRVVPVGRIPNDTRAGRYQVLGCVDVGSQLARFDGHRNCAIVGSIRSFGPVSRRRDHQLPGRR